MNTLLRFLVVEDRDDDAAEVLNQLADAGLNPDNYKGRSATYEDAQVALKEHASELDVVFLDLNIPRTQTDGRPEKGHGKALLDLIHKELNKRAGIEIKVIVVSGEDLHDGVQSSLLEEMYVGTLYGIVKKTDLTTMLKASLKRLRRDPLRSRIQKNNLDILLSYDTVFDPCLPVKERLKAGRDIGIKLLKNEIDHHNGFSNSCGDCADDISGLLNHYVKSRFSGQVKVSTMNHPGNWNQFLWRGTLIQHLYTLNSYRNCIEHLVEQPFRPTSNYPVVWEIPSELFLKLESGSSLTKMVELIITDLLEWYLPWHEQVYVPWCKEHEGV